MNSCGFVFILTLTFDIMSPAMVSANGPNVSIWIPVRMFVIGITMSLSLKEALKYYRPRNRLYRILKSLKELRRLNSSTTYRLILFLTDDSCHSLNFGYFLRKTK